MKDILFTVDKQRKFKKELLTMEWNSPDDATRIRILLDKYIGMFGYGYDKPKAISLTEIDKIRNRVLNSTETYEPNDVLDIIDEIVETMKSEE